MIIFWLLVKRQGFLKECSNGMGIAIDWKGFVDYCFITYNFYLPELL